MIVIIIEKLRLLLDASWASRESYETIPKE